MVCPANAKSGWRRGNSSATARANAPSRIRSGCTDVTPALCNGRAVTGPTQDVVTVEFIARRTASVNRSASARIKNDAAAGADVNMIASTPPSATFSIRPSSALGCSGGSHQSSVAPCLNPTAKPDSGRHDEEVRRRIDHVFSGVTQSHVVGERDHRRNCYFQIVRVFNCSDASPASATMQG